ncbi:hypothetical protein [Streptomyces shenzhenensis]|uniref:hypothetical protein n=1 Tax=Streptomyces shenzhenensis TaxID=943815 RepID=UPI0015F0D506|nr:hypothetical protein [Streptomyces shenzhenensis]
MTPPRPRRALTATALLCIALTTACGPHRATGGSGSRPPGTPAVSAPAGATVAPSPSATDLSQLTRIVDDAESAAAAADSDAAGDE